MFHFQLTVLQPQRATFNKYKMSALPAKLRLDKFPKHIYTMSPPPPPVILPGVQNTLFELSKSLNEKDLPVDGQQQSLLGRLSKKVSEKHLPVHGQKQSSLIRLPQEVRTMIWQYALSGKKIEFEEHEYIASTRRLLGYPFHCFGSEWRTIIQEDDGASLLSRELNVRHGTSLLKTCRLM